MKKIIVIMAALGMIACTGKNSTSNQQNVSSSISQEQYNAEIEELDNLVSEIVRLEHQYMETRDESIAERGEKLCKKLNDLSYSLENKVNEGKLSKEQQERINEILERLP
ncbi:MAG: hypothetical protein IJQ20_05200 [Paludibacteraceae bacterium]|nr:hypothetical protein [Paludibacteraceae bacterium]MBQ6984307.1 hypothetical protein [Paludibacteraceae bacterium]